MAQLVHLNEANRETSYQHIFRGYRVHHSFREACISLFGYHNETWNVWTHLAGCLLFLTLLLHSAMMALPTLGGNAPSLAVVLNDRLSGQLDQLRERLSIVGRANATHDDPSIAADAGVRTIAGLATVLRMLRQGPEGSSGDGTASSDEDMASAVGDGPLAAVPLRWQWASAAAGEAAGWADRASSQLDHLLAAKQRLMAELSETTLLANARLPALGTPRRRPSLEPLRERLRDVLEDASLLALAHAAQLHASALAIRTLEWHLRPLSLEWHELWAAAEHLASIPFSFPHAERGNGGGGEGCRGLHERVFSEEPPPSLARAAAAEGSQPPSTPPQQQQQQRFWSDWANGQRWSHELWGSGCPERVGWAVAETPGWPEKVAERLDRLVAEVRQLLDEARQIASSRELQPGLDLERWPLYVFVATALMCLGASAVYHLFGTANERWANRLGAFDYAGIVVLIFGSCVPICYYGFYTSPLYRHLYLWTMLALGTALFSCIFRAFFYSAAWRTLRVGLFVAFGVAALVPLLHLVVFHEYNQLSMSLLYNVGAMGGIYLGGALIYVTQFPEASFPHTFDYSFNSHNWWHCCVVAAAYMHWKAVVQLWEATSIAIATA